MRLPRLASRLALSAGLTAAALIGGYQFPAPRSVDVGPPGDDAFVDRFHDRQRAGGRFFRWSSGESVVTLDGVGWNRDQELTLRIASGRRPPEAGPAEVVVSVNGRAVGRVTATLESSDQSLVVARSTLSPWGVAAVKLSVATFPRRARDVGVAVEEVRLRPRAGLSAGLALPPLGALGTWVVGGWLFVALVSRTPLAGRRFGEAGAYAAGMLALGGASIFDRGALSRLAWEGTVALGIGYALACHVPRWRAICRGGERAPLDFLHTLGIEDLRGRQWAEVVGIVLVAIHFAGTVVAPLRWWGPKDLSVYHHGGIVWREGGDVYDVPAMRSRFGQGASERTVFAFTGPPSSVALYAPLSLLPLDRAVVVWRVINVCFMVLAGLLLWISLRLSTARPPSPLWFALALSASEPVRITLRMGQVGLLVLVLLALSLWGATLRRPTLTALGLVLAAAVKVIPGFVLLHAAFRRDGRTLAAAAGLGGILLAVIIGVGGLTPWRTWFQRVLPAISAPVAYLGNQSTQGLLRRAAGDPPREPPRFNYTFAPAGQDASAARVVGYAIGAVVLGLCLWRFGPSPGADVLRRQLEFATMIPLMLLLAPLVWEFYLAWLLVPILIMMGWLVARPLRAIEQASIVALLALAWVLMQYDTAETYGRPGWPVVLMSLGLYANLIVLGCALHLLRRRDVLGPGASAEAVAA